MVFLTKEEWQTTKAGNVPGDPDPAGITMGAAIAAMDLEASDSNRRT